MREDIINEAVEVERQESQRVEQVGWVAFILGGLVGALLVAVLAHFTAFTPIKCEGWEAPAHIMGEWVCLDLEADLGLID